MVFEGDIFLFTTAFLIHRHILPWNGTITAVGAGVFIGDLSWYYLGTKLNANNKIKIWVERVTAPFIFSLKQYPGWTIFFSKFIYGVHHTLIVRAGMLGLARKKFFYYDFPASIFWIIIIGGLGFFSSASFALIGHRLKFIEIALLIGLITLYGLKYLLCHFLKTNKR